MTRAIGLILAIAALAATAVVAKPAGSGKTRASQSKATKTAAPKAPAAPVDLVTPLFASDSVIRITIKGPINAVARNSRTRREPQMATLSLNDAAGEMHAIKLSPRGITRRRSDVCQFSPLRVEFTEKPAAASLFKGQRRLKLVTHCRQTESFQQYLLLEYAAYRLYNRLTPLSFRVRLAQVDYVEEGGKPLVSRLGFFIEDSDDVARRNGLHEAKVGDRIVATQLLARDATRVAMFEYMIGNLDWSLVAAPEGEGCCHNARLIGSAGATGGLTPLPYDFDFSGLVNAPYAVPPKSLGVSSVRSRVYRGYCRHTAELKAEVAAMAARRSDLVGVLAAIPQLDERTRQKATSYLNSFFDDAGDSEFETRTRRTCLGPPS